jgi:ATP-binding cassette subfamily B protein
MSIPKVLREVSRHLAAFPLVSLGILATILFDTLFETALPLILSWMIDNAVLKGRMDLFPLPAALLAGGWLVSVANQVWRDWLFAILTSKVLGRLRGGLEGHVRTLPYPLLRGIKSADLLTLHTADMAHIENLLLNVLPSLLFGVSYLVLGIAAMMMTHAGLGFLVLAGLPLTLVGPMVLGKRASGKGLAAREAEVELTSCAQETFAAQSLIRTYDLAEAFRLAFQAKSNLLVRRARGFYFSGNMVRRLPNMAIHLLQLAMNLVGVWQAIEGRLGVGEFIAFNLLFGNVMTAVLDLSMTLGPLLQAGLAFERLGRRSAQAAPDPAPAVARVPAPPLVTGLRFVDVTFRYSPDRRVLEGLSFEIPAGKRTAVVGASGSGKSTLAALLAGLYRPERGSILWAGTDLREIERSSLLCRLGVVFQENSILDASLRHNLLLGPEKPGDEELVWQALEGAGLAAWVKALPEGLETRAGEGGGFLSGGQKQRLALARALLRHPDLLVLDEATSALDPLNEGLVNDTLRGLAGRTTIVHITHRLQGIADYDRIVVLDQGRVAETGTHEQLLREPDGGYALMWRRQSGILVTDEGARITPTGLRAFPLFAASSDRTLEDLASSFVSETSDPGSRIIRQGQPGTMFYLIARGRVQVSIAGPRGEEVVASLSDGDFFGEMSLLESALTSANVTVVQPTVLLALEKTTFLALIRNDPTLYESVTAIARKRREENARRQSSG